MVGILGSWVLDCWVCGFPIYIYIYIYFFFFLVFLVLLPMGFLVFDFLCGFGCDHGLWLKWRFVASGMVVEVDVAG